LTLTYGLRYVRDTWRTDSDIGPIAALYQFDNQFYSGLGNRVHQPNLNFAPQLGVAWDPTGKGNTVLRGGIGLFYENSIWNNTEFDRPARLPTGLFLANPTVCSSGAAVALPLPAGGSLSPSFCGMPIGSVASQISAFQAEYQAKTVAAGPASNPSFIGNALADGGFSTGTTLLAPNYVSPRSLQMNFGIQHQIRPGMVLTADYLRNIETHTLLSIDTNHVGDARFFNLAAARAAISATNAVNNALQVSLKQHSQHPFPGALNLDLQASYQLQNYIASAQDNDFVNVATDFNNPLHYLGPNELDRTQQISFGGGTDLPFHFRLGLIGHFYSPLPATLFLSPTGNPGGIFVTDVTGDGTGDGSFAVNGSLGASRVSRLRPGRCSSSKVWFTLAQLRALGGVQETVPLAPVNKAGMSWPRAFDLSLNWLYSIKDRVTIEPGVSFFNLMNFSNFDGPANPLSGTLSGSLGSINGTPGEQPSTNRLGLGSGVFALGSPRVIEFALKVNF
jgi:hypothetical protein